MHDLKRLAASMNELSCGPGEAVVSQGSGGVGFFVILHRHAKVSQDEEDRGLLGPADYFGVVKAYPDIAWALLKRVRMSQASQAVAAG